MKYKIEKIANSQVQILCEVSKETFCEHYEKTLLSLRKELVCPGFRKGTAPKDIVERELGIEAILYKTANLIITENYAKIILQSKLEIIGQPKIEITKIAKGNEFKFKIENFIIPEINLPDYKEIATKIKNEKEPINQEEIAKEINSNLLFLQKTKATQIIKNNPAEKGDWIEISFSSFSINNNKTEKQQFILGEGRLIPGFEEQIIGMKKGEEKSFSVQFPENHFEATLSNKEIVFNVKLEGVYTLKLPSLDDDFAKSLGKFKNLQQLREDIENEIINQKKEIIRQNKRENLLKNIIKNAIITIPQEILEQEKNGLLAGFKERVNDYFKISFNEYLQRIKKTEAEFEKMSYHRAEENLKTFFIINKIAATEKIVLSDKDIEDKAVHIKEEINFSEGKQKKEYNFEDCKAQAKTILLEEKIFNLLLDE